MGRALSEHAHNRYVVYVSIPPFAPVTGLLLPGEHPATWDEIEARFGWNLRRRQLLDGLADGLAAFAGAGCSRVWLNGSFVTNKDEPGDFDCVWSTVGVDRNTLQNTAPEVLDLSDHRSAQRPASEASSSRT